MAPRNLLNPDIYPSQVLNQPVPQDFFGVNRNALSAIGAGIAVPCGGCGCYGNSSTTGARRRHGLRGDQRALLQYLVTTTSCHATP